MRGHSRLCSRDGSIARLTSALRKSPDNEAPAFGKMAKLFSLGGTPREMEGHF